MATYLCRQPLRTIVAIPLLKLREEGQQRPTEDACDHDAAHGNAGRLPRSLLAEVGAEHHRQGPGKAVGEGHGRDQQEPAPVRAPKHEAVGVPLPKNERWDVEQPQDHVDPKSFFVQTWCHEICKGPAGQVKHLEGSGEKQRKKVRVFGKGRSAPRGPMAHDLREDGHCHCEDQPDVQRLGPNLFEHCADV
eukprot:CAMPEP_0171077654 /NCGR_PEP_ID=MMETSP0766_2-20121228/14160_1 /TAXON_ID=439317 /ORGANISM="Gambierdiscus australes, Strain CAWD 149" /LENGTH=190 /DNA_ID=CAMNT_0011534727 /DNA_START=130 /DNA_END=700 /DNA_ORIENTATION=-